jgi:membrane protein implicated in regulation of membrane protease activity
VNRALDAVAEHPRVTSGAVLVAGVVLPVAAVWVSLTGAAAVAGVMAAYVLALGHRIRVLRLKEQLQQRDYDLAAERAEVARLRAGDPTAPTTQLRPIGDRGELL